MFLRYKQLKKQLKQLKKHRADSTQDTASAEAAVQKQPAEEGSSATALGLGGVQLSAQEMQFMQTLNEDLSKFNNFFIDREEEAVIQLQTLSEQLREARTAESQTALKSRIVEFHGSCILLLHWSLLNYAAVAKILKKHDKLTGVLMRAPMLANVLQQPFNSTSIMSRLVRQAEELLQQSMAGEAAGGAAAGGGNMCATGSAVASGGVASGRVGTGATCSPSRPTSAAPAPALGAGDAAGTEGGHASGDDEASSHYTGAGPAPTQVAPLMYQRTRLALDTWVELSKTAVTPSTIISEATPPSAPASEGSLPVLMVGAQGGSLPRLGYLSRGPSTTSAAVTTAVAPAAPASSPPPLPTTQLHLQQPTSGLSGRQQHRQQRQQQQTPPDTAEAVGDNMMALREGEEGGRPAKRVCR